jgi:dimethylargininase
MKSGTFTKAIVRKPALSLGAGLTEAGLGSPDPELTAGQHRAYCDALRSCGVEVILLDAVEEYPDSTFVEDPAVIMGGTAVITRPGHPSRLGETGLIEPVLSRYLEIEKISPPGRLDGGDVLEMDDRILIGISDRTDIEGAEQLRFFANGAGFECATVPVPLGLHLKSGVSYLGEGIILADSSIAGISEFSGMEVITVAEGEEYCANSIAANGRILFPSGFPRTRAMLACAGLEVIELDMSEFRKMDGGLSCLSLRMNI